MSVAVDPEPLTRAAGRNVLLVEDDGPLCYALASALRAAGFDVVAVTDSLKAMTAMDNGAPIDLLVTDIFMPHGNLHGFALARMARARRHGLRVLFVTGASDILDDELDGGSIVIHKPVELDALVDAVELALKAGR